MNEMYYTDVYMMLVSIQDPYISKTSHIDLNDR